MTTQLRYYQTALLEEVERQWTLGYKNVCLMATTGAGKTPTLGAAIKRHKGPSCAIAHRSNLVAQLSLALAKEGVVHRVIASEKTLRSIAAKHAKEFGRVYLDPQARCAVASAQTLVRRDMAAWFASVTLWVVDEAHHLIKGTVWGKCVEKFTNPQCKGLGPTATPGRADGQGLGRNSDGYMDVMVALVEDGDRLGVAVAYEGESITCAPAKVLMDQGYLSRYKIACVESHISEFLGDVAKSGDWSQAQLKSASEHSSIIGDVVQSYLAYSAGKIGITFSTDVESATHITQAYRAAGVPAELVTGETEDSVRWAIFDRLERREIKQIVAVDVISEGTDLPGLEDVCFARPTASLGLFLQQLGRGIRPMEGKLFTQLRDHVGNFLRHRGGPDTPRTWSLDRRPGKGSGASDAEPIRVCLNVTCGLSYERFRDACPFCGQPAPEPDRRGPPDQVDGVLALLDDETLARLRGETPETASEYMTRLAASGLPARYVAANTRKHQERLDALGRVWDEMGRLGGIWKAQGLSDTECQRRWWQLTGLDVLSAQRLDKADAEKLLLKLGVDG